MAQNATGAAWSRSGGATRVGASMADAEQKRRNAEYSAKYHAKKKAEHAELVAANAQLATQLQDSRARETELNRQLAAARAASSDLATQLADATAAAGVVGDAEPPSDDAPPKQPALGDTVHVWFRNSDEYAGGDGFEIGTVAKLHGDGFDVKFRTGPLFGVLLSAQGKDEGWRFAPPTPALESKPEELMALIIEQMEPRAGGNVISAYVPEKDGGVPLQGCMKEKMLKLHIVWLPAAVGQRQAYDTSTHLGEDPHYTRHSDEIEELMATAMAAGIPFEQYASSTNYLDEDGAEPRFIRVINDLSDPLLDGKMDGLEEIDMEAIAALMFRPPRTTLVGGKMRKLEPKPLGWLETERGNYIVGAGPTSQIYMTRMLDDDVNYEGIAGLLLTSLACC